MYKNFFKKGKDADLMNSWNNYITMAMKEILGPCIAPGYASSIMLSAKLSILRLDLFLDE